eukprot:jgi/Astpho2/4307/Aster-07398
MKFKPGSSKRQDRNFEVVVNHITTNEDQLPQVSRQSMAALKAPKTKSTVKARIAASMALIFGTEAGSVDVKLFYELKADAGPAHGLKGLGDYRSMYVNNNDHENHRPKILSVPPGWMADRAPARASVTYNLPAVVIADVRKAR